MKSVNHNSPDQWSELYTADRAAWDDMRRSGQVITPATILFFIAIMYVLFYASSLLKLTENVFAKLGAFSLFFIPIIVVALVYILASRGARSFFRAFYKPPDGTDAGKLIGRRLFGIPPLPKLLSALIHYPFVIINIKDVTEGKFRLENEVAHWLGGPLILVVLDGAGVYLQRGNQFSRALGPGLYFLERFETLREVLDLRTQVIRSGQGSESPPPIGGRTKDGIRIFFNVEATFRIKRPPIPIGEYEGVDRKAQENLYADRETAEKYLMGTDDAQIEEEKDALEKLLTKPVDDAERDAIRKAYESTVVRYQRNGDDRKYTEGKWRDGVWGTISGDLAKYITRHYLDELLVSVGPESDDFLPPSNAQVNRQGYILPKAGCLLSWQEREKLRKSMDDYLQKNRGVTLLNLRILDFEIPPEVYQQRIQVLEAETKSRITRIKGRAAAEQILIREQARVQAQQELIENIADSFGQVDKENFADSVLLSLSGILSESLDDPELSTFVARDTLRTLEQLQEFLTKREPDNDDRIFR